MPRETYEGGFKTFLVVMGCMGLGVVGLAFPPFGIALIIIIALAWGK